MAESSPLHVVPPAELFSSSARPTVGRIVHVSSDGRPSVDFPGNDWGPLEARAICDPPADMSLEELCRAEVLLLFVNDDARVPLIVGFLRSHWTLPAQTNAPATYPTAEDETRLAQAIAATDQSRRAGTTTKIDGPRVLINAEKEIQLRCGRSSITLRQDGKIVVKGMHIVSRAEGPHRIKGGSVTIN